jgi:protein gp37
MKNTKIEWTEDSWNPVTGCLHGCEYCYAYDIAHRFGGWTLPSGKKPTLHAPLPDEFAGLPELDCAIRVTRKNGKEQAAPYPYDFTPTLHRYHLAKPQTWKAPKTVFVGSMCDLFGEWVPDEWITAVFNACAAAPQHRYLFLTKNPKRYMTLIKAGKLPPEHWYGETQTRGELWGLPKPYKHFISVEPLMGKIQISPLTGIDWIVTGAETGNRKGKVTPTARMVKALVEECDAYGGYKGNSRIPVFMKDSLLPVVGESNMRREYPW